MSNNVYGMLDFLESSIVQPCHETENGFSRNTYDDDDSHDEQPDIGSGNDFSSVSFLASSESSFSIKGLDGYILFALYRDTRINPFGIPMLVRILS